MILKNSIVVVLVLSILAQSFSGFLILVDYNVNTNKYSVNCINKAKPKLKCNGKCQMMKKMQEEENAKASDKETAKKYELKFQIISSKSFYATIATSVLTIQQLYIDGTLAKHPRDMAYGIFHPPQV